MIIQQAKELQLSKKKVWQTKHFFLILIFTVLFIGEIVFIIMVPVVNDKDLIIELVLLVLTIGVDLVFLQMAQRKLKQYNDLIDTGIVLIGKTTKLIIYDIQGIDIEATFFDSDSGKVYYYKEYDWTIANRIFYPNVVLYVNADLKKHPEEHPYIKKHPYIYILADKNNYEKGYLLIREYLDGIPNLE